MTTTMPKTQTEPDFAALEADVRKAVVAYQLARRRLEDTRGALAIARAVADGSFDREPDLERDLNYYGVTSAYAVGSAGAWKVAS